MIDSHCHLHYDYAPKTGEQLVAEARAAGVEHLVTVGVDLATLSQIEKISESLSGVTHTVGVHPQDVAQLLEDAESGLSRLRTAAAHPKCSAIGEIGLDYHYEGIDPLAQQKVLDLQLDLALQLGLPVVIHSRDAESDLLASLTRYAKKAQAPRVGAIHCFTGTYAFGKACLDLGFLISFSGILTFKNAEDLRECARAFPLDRLLVETDAPYLAPIPFRGKRCEPAMVMETARFLAGLKGVALAEVDRATTANARALFALG